MAERGPALAVPMTNNAACEGDDLPEPLRIYLYGDGFASIDGELQMSAFGPSALATLAKKLLRIGYDADCELAKVAGTCRARELISRPSKTTKQARPAGLPSLPVRLWRAPGCGHNADPAAALQRIGTKMKFNSTDNRGGRPRGSRNKLFTQVFEDVLQHWNQPVPGRNISQGMAALEVMRKERPAEYVKAVLSIMPKELLLSDSTMADLNDEQIDTLLATLRKQVLEHAVELN
jgi:hypothetical protein